MSELEYIDLFHDRWPEGAKDPEPTKETITLINQAIEEYPNSEKLWVIRGDLLQLINYEHDIPLEESLVCYKKALIINPKSYEANFEIASFLNNVLDKPREAHKFYRIAQSLKNA
jgi:tetratricopeptide (TPR) repeat protein|tara:strand:- start:35207 stop:35551 length:345 start_codon:yes stop_codon:yes gene_type:complete